MRRAAQFAFLSFLLQVQLVCALEQEMSIRALEELSVGVQTVLWITEIGRGVEQLQEDNSLPMAIEGFEVFKWVLGQALDANQEYEKRKDQIQHTRRQSSAFDTVIAFRYSNSFFDLISKDCNIRVIERLKISVEKLAQTYGWYFNPSSQMTFPSRAGGSILYWQSVILGRLSTWTVYSQVLKQKEGLLGRAAALSKKVFEASNNDADSASRIAAIDEIELFLSEAGRFESIFLQLALDDLRGLIDLYWAWSHTHRKE